MQIQIEKHTELEVYKQSFDVAMKIFETSKALYQAYDEVIRMIVAMIHNHDTSTIPA